MGYYLQAIITVALGSYYNFGILLIMQALAGAGTYSRVDDATATNWNIS